MSGFQAHDYGLLNGWRLAKSIHKILKIFTTALHKILKLFSSRLNIHNGLFSVPRLMILVGGKGFTHMKTYYLFFNLFSMPAFTHSSAISSAASEPLFNLEELLRHMLPWAMWLWLHSAHSQSVWLSDNFPEDKQISYHLCIISLTRATLPEII